MKRTLLGKDTKLMEIMKKNGVPNHSKALFYGLIAAAVQDSDCEILKAKSNMENTIAHKLAAKLIALYLENKKFRITLQTIIAEGPSSAYNEENNIDLGLLELPRRYPPIKKLIRQRCVARGALNSDDEEHSSDEATWYKIDSEAGDTITLEPTTGSTYQIPFTLDEVSDKVTATKDHFNEKKKIGSRQTTTGSRGTETKFSNTNSPLSVSHVIESDNPRRQQIYGTVKRDETQRRGRRVDTGSESNKEKQ